jgi:hypothetical protein
MTTTKKLMVRIHNVETNEVIDREMNNEELAEYKANQVLEDTEIAQAKSKATARQAILDRLGLTAEEAALLLG